MLPQPMGYVGQPSAFAWDCHIAMTIGLVTKDGSESVGELVGVLGGVTATRSLPFLACHCWLSNEIQALPPGLQTSGCSSPSRISCIANPESIGVAWTLIGLLQVVRCWSLKSL